MSHIYENDTKPILSDPPYLLQFILSVDWPGTSAGA